MRISLYNHQKDFLIDKPLIRRIVRLLLGYLQISCEEISIYFVTEKKIIDLHEIYFNDPSPTDCITFPIDDEHIGEIFICPKQAVLYAKNREKDPFDELLLYIVHGILHLLGYDDLDPKSRETMRKKEKSCIAFIRGCL